MSAFSETCNRAHNILELVDISPNVSFTASETERDYCYQNCKHELTDELPNDIRPKKIPKLQEIIF